jgi:hypothetical protein
MVHLQGVAINLLFQSDLFSGGRPGWLPVEEPSELILSEVFSFLPKFCKYIDGRPQKSGAFGINSNNYRFRSDDREYVLKRWTQKASLSDVRESLRVMTWLNSMKLPVPNPLEFHQGDVLLTLKSGSWSFFPFVGGNYFSGVGDELEVAADMTGLITQTLQGLPDKIKLSRGPEFISDHVGVVLSKTEDYYSEWETIFGIENARLLQESWPALRKEFQRLKKLTLSSGVIQAAHYDLHPHNILIENYTVSGVLDFESCKQIDPGYALGFAALKQCRQVVACYDSPSNAKIIGDKYMSIIQQRYDFPRDFMDKLGDFAVAEVVRRVCLILELNLNQKISSWNHVLGIQLNHIGEARALFGR